MELDELKTQWRELGERLDGANARIDRLTAEIAAGKIGPARHRLIRMNLLAIFLLASLPFLFVNLLCRTNPAPGIAFRVLLGLFIVVMVAGQVMQLMLLQKLEPGKQSIREFCASVLRFRRRFLAGVAVGVTLMVPLMTLFGVYLWSLGEPYLFSGFVVGMVVGLGLGTCVFLRRLSDMNRLRDALRDMEE